MKKFKTATLTSLLAILVSTNSGLAQDDQPVEIEIDVPDEIVIRGVNIPNEKRATSEISSVLDEVAFARQGDSDIAGALRRVTGVSITDGKFPVVRGLNERYTNATINGASLPSPEPLRKAAPLDIFPTSILSGSLVQKTYSPQFSGEFGGAVIELRTKKIPDENFLEVGIGGSVNSETSFQNGLFLDGGDTDWLGIDDGLRDFPDGVEALLNIRGQNGRLTQDEQNALDTSFENSKTLLISSNDTTPMNGDISITLGRVLKDDGDIRIGLVAYGGYSNDWQSRDGKRSRPRFDASSGLFNTDPIDQQSSYQSTQQSISLNGLVSTGVEIGDDHELGFTGFILRSTDKEARLADSQDRDFFDNNIFRQENTEWVERQLWQTQISGEHIFPGLKDLEANWRVSYGEAERFAPYERQTTYGPNGNFNTQETGENFLRFSDLQDDNTEAALDFEYPLIFGEREADLSFGVAIADRGRITARRDFELQGELPTEILGSRADIIFSNEILGLNNVFLQPSATLGFPDNFEGTLETSAAYAAADVLINDYIRIALGARYEESTQQVSTFTTGRADTVQAFAPLEEDYVLPAVTFTFEPLDNVKARLGISQTIIRPQFRELAPSIFVDRDTDISFTGNPFLVNTEIDNIDARLEWYFSRSQFLTVGAFYKDMQKPIEEAIDSTEAGRTTFFNAPSAELYGVELEFERTFPLYDVIEGEYWEDKEIFLNTNYTYTQSEVSAEGDVILAAVSRQSIDPDIRAASGVFEDGRQLQGQSEHLFNLQLGITNPDSGMQSTLLINYASERIRYVGQAASGGVFAPSVIDNPPLSVDYVHRQPIELFGNEYTMGFKIKNILDEEFSLTREDRERSFDFETYDTGREVSLSLKRQF